MQHKRGQWMANITFRLYNLQLQRRIKISFYRIITLRRYFVIGAANFFGPQKFRSVLLQIEMDPSMTAQMIQQFVFLITEITLEHAVNAVASQMQRQILFQCKFLGAVSAEILFHQRGNQMGLFVRVQRTLLIVRFAAVADKRFGAGVYLGVFVQIANVSEARRT